MPTKDELEAENADLREQLADARADKPAAARKPERPKDAAGKPVLSAGEKNDLEMHGATISPFNGQLINAIDEGVETNTPEAHRRALDAKAGRGEFANQNIGTASAPPAAAPPAEQE